MSNNIDRKMLGFEDAVQKHFVFLCDMYDYKCIFSDLYCVRYSSKKAYVNIYHEKISYELYLEIGMLPEDYSNPLKVNSSEIIAMSGIESKNVFYQASSKNDVYMVVEKFSDITLLYAKGALNASIEYFNSVVRYRKQKQQNALLLQELKLAEKKVKDACNIKDYEVIVEVYSKLEKHLNPFQLKTLDYAKKMLSNTIEN